jgi:hypothetical protein
MENFSMLGRWLVVIGLGVTLLGGLIWLLGKIPALRNLPGTIKIEGNGFTCVFPILASIVLSILLTILLNIIARFINH